MNRRHLLVTGFAGALSAVGGCIDEFDATSDPNGTDDEPSVEVAEDAPITDVEVREATPIGDHHYEEPIAVFVGSETGGERAVAAEPSFESVVEDTDFSRSVLLHAVTWGTNGCYSLDVRELEMLDGSVHLIVHRREDSAEREEKGCDDGMPTLATTVRVTFDDEPPDAGLITFVGQDAEREAVDVEDWNP